MSSSVMWGTYWSVFMKIFCRYCFNGDRSNCTRRTSTAWHDTRTTAVPLARPLARPSFPVTEPSLLVLRNEASPRLAVILAALVLSAEICSPVNVA